VTLKFGTDGVRGVAGVELTVELTAALGRAAVRALGPGPFLVARDTRRSGPMLEAAFAAGVCSEGGSVERLGVLPTPGLAGACRAAAAPGAMISASHNPFPDNGIKLFEPGGRKLADATEERIESALADVLAAGGTARSGADVGVVTDAAGAVDAYVERLLGALSAPDALAGITVVVDCGNGAASVAAPRALRAAGATVHVLHDAPDGTNINAGCGSTAPEVVAARVVETGAVAGLALDGDADRVIAVDEHGAVVDGDHLLAMFALDLAARGRLAQGAIATTVMANLGLHQALAAEGIRVVETPVGDRHVLTAMEDEGIVLGGEQSGHLIFAEHAVTGDGTLAGLLVLDLLARSGRPLSELAAVVVKHPQVLRNVRVRDRAGLDDAAGFWSEVRALEAELGADGRVLVRPSGTEPVVRVMVEAGDPDTATRGAERLVGALEAALGTEPQPAP
jgi:phosphoglucosamine mutase